MMGKFDMFNRSDFTYKSVEGHPVQTSVWAPKSRELCSKKAPSVPVIVYWHGGGFVAGYGRYEPWWPVWLIELATTYEAIIIGPDYRLMPEANGSDVLDDVESFWDWFSNDLPRICNAWRIQPDLEDILCCGQSSGGWLAAQSPLLRPKMKIKAILTISSPLYTNVPAITVPQPRTIMGAPPVPPMEAEKMIRQYIRDMPPLAVRTGGDPKVFWNLMTCLLQRGWIPKLIFKKLSEDDRLDIIQSTKRAGMLPPLWAIHSLGDSVIPATTTTEFVRQITKELPEWQVLVTLEQGEHSFDVGLTRKEPWVQDGFGFICEYWPASQP